MRRVLIVSPHFPPVNAADHHRVRMALPYLRELGWEATVLAVDPKEIDGMPREAMLEQSLPADIQVVRTGAVPLTLAARVGMRTLALRAYPYLARAGAKLLRTQSFDLVFFSTTQFAVMGLGPRWLKQFRIPYVLDFQDPWLSDYHVGRDLAKAPGGKWKYRFSQWIGRRLEPKSVRACAHAVCVSPDYPGLLQRRYPDLESSRFSVLPFGVAERDFEIAENPEVTQSIFDPRDGRQHWVYVGRGQPDMAQALRGFFHALAEKIRIDPATRHKIVVHFVGTSYASAERAVKSVEPIAAECGVSDCVDEHPERIPYFEALCCLLDADALILPGSDDSSYIASKLMPCLFAQKPMLAVFHEASSVVATLREFGVETVATFRADTPTKDLAQRILEAWFQRLPGSVSIVSRDRLDPYSARSMTVRLAQILDRAAASAQSELAPRAD